MELKNEINLIVWGFIPELNYALKKYGFTVLLQSELEVGLYERKKSKRTKEDGHITIGGLAYAAAVKVAKKYYSNKNIIVTIKEYSGYNEAIKKLDEGEIDYVVGPPSFYRGITPTIRNRYEKIFLFPNAGKIFVYLLKTEDGFDIENVVANYLIENINAFNQVFSIKAFTRNIHP